MKGAQEPDNGAGEVKMGINPEGGKDATHPDQSGGGDRKGNETSMRGTLYDRMYDRRERIGTSVRV
jgi:hypothetical protein